MTEEMKKENTEQATGNQEEAQQGQQNTAPQQPETPPMDKAHNPKVEEGVYVKVNPTLYKIGSIAKKILKYAVPVGIAAGSVFLGVKLGEGSEKKRSASTIDGLQNALDKANADIAALESREIPALPELPPAPQIPEILSDSVLETGEF